MIYMIIDKAFNIWGPVICYSQWTVIQAIICGSRKRPIACIQSGIASIVLVAGPVAETATDPDNIASIIINGPDLTEGRISFQATSYSFWDTFKPCLSISICFAANYKDKRSFRALSRFVKAVEYPILITKFMVTSQSMELHSGRPGFNESVPKDMGFLAILFPW